MEVIIIHYNTWGLLENLLTLLAKEPITKIFVVDNASNPKPIAWIDPCKIEWIYSKENLGYARGIQLAWNLCQGPNILVLNPDLYWDQPICEHLNQKLQNYSWVSPIVLTHQTLGLTYGNFPSWLSPLFYLPGMGKLLPELCKKYALAPNGHKKIGPVDYACGGAMLLKKQDVDAVGGWSQDFFLYFEETDLAKRLSDKGYGVAIVDVKIHHLQGASQNTLGRSHHFYEGMSVYFKRNHSYAFYLWHKVLFCLGLGLAFFLKRHTLQELKFCLQYFRYS